MKTKLTPDTLGAFIESHFSTKEHPTVPYSVDIAYHDQAEVRLGIKVKGLDCDQCVIDWVETFGKCYQMNLVDQIIDGDQIISGLTFWLDDNFHNDPAWGGLCKRWELEELVSD